MPSNPRPRKVCECAACKAYSFIDPTSGGRVYGRMVSEGEYRLHKGAALSGWAAMVHPPTVQPHATLTSDDAFVTSLCNATFLATRTSLKFIHADKQNNTSDTIPSSYDLHVSSSSSEHLFGLTDSPDNRQFREAEGLVKQLRAFLTEGSPEQQAQRRSAVEDAEATLFQHLKTEWSRQRPRLTQQQSYKRQVNTGKSNSRSMYWQMNSVSADSLFKPWKERSTAALAFTLSLLIAYYFKRSTESATRLVALGFRASADRPTALQQPRDVDTMSADFHLDPDIETYSMCPRSQCCALYTISPSLSASHRCTSTYAAPPNICGADLYQTKTIKGRPHDVPILKVAYHRLRAWLARMLSRADIEPYLEEYKTHRPGSEMHDIWDSERWWDFHDGFMRDVETPGSGKDNRLKLLFGLSMDGFNPFQIKAAKQVRIFSFLLRPSLSSFIYPPKFFTETDCLCRLPSALEPPCPSPISSREHLPRLCLAPPPFHIRDQSRFAYTGRGLSRGSIRAMVFKNISLPQWPASSSCNLARHRRYASHSPVGGTG